MRQRLSTQRSSRVRFDIAQRDQFDRELTSIVERAVESVTEKVGSVLRNRASREEDESERSA